MSQAQDERAMDQSYGPGGSVRRARERAEAAGFARAKEQPFSSIPIPRRMAGNPSPNEGNRPSVTLQTKDGNIGASISRPTPVPQWPLAGPIPTFTSAQPYQPPPGKSTPPQRPPRPSRVPSILDGSRIQDHTPVFQYQPQDPRVSELSVSETIATTSSRPSTLSSVGSIPDFPLPNAPPLPTTPSRRSVNLGPPPSARRGASSFYSVASYVSPIPEESPSRRSYASYASSAAIPESFGTISPAFSSPGDGFYDDTIAEESVQSDDADERQLVRSASIGKRARPALVDTRGMDAGEATPITLPIPRPKPKPVQPEPFQGGTGLIDETSSSSEVASSQNVNVAVAAGASGNAVTQDSMLGAYEAASATDPSTLRRPAPSPRPFRLSQLRRPPPLDIGAVRKAEARGSLTSLPDLIRRATRLAAMMDRGKRPASNFNDLDFPEDVYRYNYAPRDMEKDYAQDGEKYQSGFSDMLAAFPPPAQANNNPRQSVRQSLTSWPLPIGRTSFRRSFRAAPPPPDDIPRQFQEFQAEPKAEPERQYAMDAPSEEEANPPRLEANPQKKKRRCCGLPTWVVILLVAVIAAIIAAAIIVPVELLVVQKQNRKGEPDTAPQLSDCQAQMTCQNGGTNVVVQGVCSCICSNGFTGATCTVPGSQGCTSTSFTDSTAPKPNLDNVTLGEAIPRLIQQAQANFSITLSPTTILSKFNAANLSCNAENALVTFDGQSSSLAGAEAQVVDLDPDSSLLRAANGQPLTLTVLPDVNLTITIPLPNPTESFSFSVTTLTNPTSIPSGSTIFQTTLTESKTTSTPSATTAATTTPKTRTTPTTATTMTTTSSTAPPSNTFTVTEQVVDFSRIAVLLILQEQQLVDAATAQVMLQRFFGRVGLPSSSAGISMDQARNVTLGGKNSVNLVNFSADVGNGIVGGRTG